MKIFKFELGQKVKEVHTGYAGVIMARTDHITGCKQYGVLNRKLDKDGDIKEWVWFDEDRLVCVGRKKKAQVAIGVGGPCETAPSR